MKSEKYDKIIEALIKKASEILPKGSQMALYGSRARGDARPDSDWDIHILIQGNEHISISEESKYADPIEKVGWDFDEYINARVHSYAGWMKRHFLPFFKNVEHDKIIIFQN